MGKTLNQLSGTIEFQHVQFQYPNREVEVSLSCHNSFVDITEYLS